MIIGTKNKGDLNNNFSFLKTTSNQFKKIVGTNKPAQPINDLEILLQEAHFVKVLVDYAMPIMLEKYLQNTNLSFSDKMDNNSISFIKAPNKKASRIKKKLEEDSVGDYQNILDYVRCGISFPTLESLFNFVNFANEFTFSPLDFKDFEGLDLLNALPRFVYGVNNFAIDNLSDELLKTYSFLKKSVNLKYTEFMDYKLYMKIPLMGENNYMIVEVLCTLHEFNKCYELTHYLYEFARDLAKSKDFLNTVSPEIVSKYFNAIICYIHQKKVISLYNNRNNKNNLQMFSAQSKSNLYKKDMENLEYDYADILNTKLIIESAGQKYQQQLVNIIDNLISERG